MTTNTEESRRERTQMARQHVFVVNGAPACLDVMRDILQEERYNVTNTNFMCPSPSSTSRPWSLPC